jgi:hypothetical protein
MRMIWHDYGYVQVISDPMIVEAARENDVAGPVWQDAAIPGHEGDEVRFIVTLQVREDAAVEGHDSVSLFHEVGAL